MHSLYFYLHCDEFLGSSKFIAFFYIVNIHTPGLRAYTQYTSMVNKLLLLLISTCNSKSIGLVSVTAFSATN